MKLKDYLKTKGISQKEFAREIDVSPQALGRYANGTRIPEPVSMSAIHDATDGWVTANDFYGLPNSTAAAPPTADGGGSGKRA